VIAITVKRHPCQGFAALPLAATRFLCNATKKSGKENAPRCGGLRLSSRSASHLGHGLTALPCADIPFAASCGLSPAATGTLGAAEGVGRNTSVVHGLFLQVPFDAAEHRSRGRNSPKGARLERALTCGTGMCRRASAPAARSAGHRSAHRAERQVAGRRFFGDFLWASKESYSPVRAKFAGKLWGRNPALSLYGQLRSRQAGQNKIEGRMLPC
jgi:hypothetical protein